MIGQACADFFHQWRLWIRPVVITLYALVIIVLLPFLIVKAAKNGFKQEDQEILFAGIFVLMALPISVWQIIQHMVYYTKPYLQKHIIRVLWMVPIYALNAWLGLIFPVQSIYLDSLRECYEAYVIYNFMVYLLNYLNAEMDLEANLELKPQVNHIFPLCCLVPWEMGREFVHMCKHGILQYTVVRPLTTGISFICELCNVYGEGEFRWNTAFPYMIAINNFSQFVAMYCLVLFYRANRVELQPMKPIGKFLCIKAVVFFSFFQGVIIAILVYSGVINSVFDVNGGDVKTVSSKLQDFLICIEMFLAAVAHHYSFSYKPFVDQNAENISCCSAFLAMWDVSDVQRDIKEHFEVVGSSLSRRIRGHTAYHRLYPSASASETARLLVPAETSRSAPARLGDEHGYNSISPTSPVENNENSDALIDFSDTSPLSEDFPKT